MNRYPDNLHPTAELSRDQMLFEAVLEQQCRQQAPHKLQQKICELHRKLASMLADACDTEVATVVAVIIVRVSPAHLPVTLAFSFPFSLTLASLGCEREREQNVPFLYSGSHFTRKIKIILLPPMSERLSVHGRLKPLQARTWRKRWHPPFLDHTVS